MWILPAFSCFFFVFFLRIRIGTQDRLLKAEKKANSLDFFRLSTYGDSRFPPRSLLILIIKRQNSESAVSPRSLWNFRKTWKNHFLEAQNRVLEAIFSSPRKAPKTDISTHTCIPYVLRSSRIIDRGLPHIWNDSHQGDRGFGEVVLEAFILSILS